jgi:hypothetical protein
MKIVNLLIVLMFVFVINAAELPVWSLTHSQPTVTVFALAHDIPANKMLTEQDVAPVVFDEYIYDAEAEALNWKDLCHSLAEFIGMRLKPGSEESDKSIRKAGELITKDRLYGKVKTPISKIALSPTVPVLITTDDVLDGQVLSRDNTIQVQVKRAEMPVNPILYFTRSENRLAMVPMKKGSYVTYNLVTDPKFESNIRCFYAVHDLKSGECLNWKDLQAKIDDRDEINRTRLNANFEIFTGAYKLFPLQVFNYGDWRDYFLVTNLKKGDRLEHSSLGERKYDFEPSIHRWDLVKYIRVTQDVPTGKPISAEDVCEVQRVDRGEEHPNLTSVNQVIGRTSKYRLKKGGTLPDYYLKPRG